MDRINQRKARRTQFMNELFDMADGSEMEFVSTTDVAKRLGLAFERGQDRDEVMNLGRYLEEEGLINAIGMGMFQIRLTHEGVREVEEARSKPDEPTEHFASFNFVYAESISNSNVQQGSPGAHQYLNVAGPEQVQRIEPVVQALRESIDDLGLVETDRAELEAEVRTLESQVASPKPKKEIIESGLRSAQRIVEGAAAGAASSGLLQAIQAALSFL